jgi:hypothetical protein
MILSVFHVGKTLISRDNFLFFWKTSQIQLLYCKF